MVNVGALLEFGGIMEPVEHTNLAGLLEMAFIRKMSVSLAYWKCPICLRSVIFWVVVTAACLYKC